MMVWRIFRGLNRLMMNRMSEEDKKLLDAEV
jgi:hypothetical protein